METLTLAPPPPRRRSFLFHQISVLLLTFSAYAAFHASRKPPSIVKSILGPEVAASNASADAGWPPFDGPRGPHRLGELDLAFLSSYSAGMYLAGHVGDRIDLRRFLAFGMLGSGISTAAFGMGYWWGVHRLGFFLAVQIVSGLFQSIGWPCVVAVVGNWFGKSKRGLIMGAWNSHTSVGNILGSVVASSVLEFGWGWSFVLPGILIIIVGAFVLAFLVVDPKDLGFESQDMEIEMNDAGNELGGSANGANGEEVGLLGSGEKSDLDLKTADLDSKAAIGFLEAWRLPSVAPYAFCLFFSKLVAYTFLYWLPFYIRHTAYYLNPRFQYTVPGIDMDDELLAALRNVIYKIVPDPEIASLCIQETKPFREGTDSFGVSTAVVSKKKMNPAVSGKHLSHKTAGILSTIFDIGGVFGGISSGFISDRLGARAVTSVLFLLFSIPSLILYRLYGSMSMHLNIGLMFLSGYFVNGPYSLITTAVAADLGTQDMIKGNSRALATVTAIIDGTGSVGAALGPLLTGYISTRGWNSVFLMLIFSTSLAILFLIHIAKAEVTSKMSQRR